MNDFPHRAAAVVSTGDELTLGQALDTNSRWLSERLLSLGVPVVEHVTLGDDLPALVAALRRLAERTDLIVLTGGLGPTADDLTRAALAQATGDTLVEDPESLAQIESWYTSRKRAMPALNRVQAQRASRARALPNDRGTAPGLHAVLSAGAPARHADVFCLPGPPMEMVPMFEREVTPALRPDPARTIVTRALPTFGLGESDIAQRLGTMMARDAVPLVGTTASKGVVTVRIRYDGPLPRPEAVAVVDDTERRVRDALGPFVIGAPGGAPDASAALPEAVIAALASRGQSLAVVESCTGGLLGAALTAVPGSSRAFLGGWITYSNEMKSAHAGVAPERFATDGAVSRRVASDMAAGGLERSGADHCLAITGIAGPEGGTPDKPVGTVWIALASRGGASRGGASRAGIASAATPGTHDVGPVIDARRFRMIGDRAAVRDWSVSAALGLLWLTLAGHSSRVKLLREVDDDPRPQPA